MIKKILISQDAPKTANSPYTLLQERLGVEFDFYRFIKIEPVTANNFRKQNVALSDYSAVVFTTRHAVDNYFRLAKELHMQVSDKTKFFGLSEQIINYTQHYIPYRKRRVFFPERGHWSELIDLMRCHPGDRFLVPQSDPHTDEVAQRLEEAGLDHTECVMYRTVSNNFKKGPKVEDYDMIVLFTPAGVQSLVSNFPHWEQGETKLACFGPTTAAAFHEAGLRADLQGDPKSISIIAALETFIRQENGLD